MQDRDQQVGKEGRMDAEVSGGDDPMVPTHILKSLNELNAADQLRRLRLGSEDWVDFSSNDYLGLRGEKRPKDSSNRNSGSEGILEDSSRWSSDSAVKSIDFGAGGSRLLTGNHLEHEDLEQFCADYFQAPATLLFNSGYHANLGLLSSIAGRHDTYLYDERVHASIKDGIRLSSARKWSFRHQDLEDLERLLKRASGTIYVVVEGLYSMDGDHPDLPVLVELVKQYGAWLILDEAHSTGLYGPQGAGLAAHYRLQNRIFARIYTYGKAPGWYGAVVAGSRELRDFLINKARTFIYSTALPPASVRILKEKLERLQLADRERAQLAEICTLTRKLTDQTTEAPLFSPILPVIIPGNSAVKAIAEHLQKSKFDVRPILAPTVSAGSERLRVILHSFNTPTEIYAFSTQLMALLG